MGVKTLLRDLARVFGENIDEHCEID